MYRKKEGTAGEGINLNRLLTDLHAKKRWLDQVIGALEAVSTSPELKLVEAVKAVIGEDRETQPKVDLLSGQKRRLARLTARVSGSKNRRSGGGATP